MSHVQHQTMSITSWDEEKLFEVQEKLISKGIKVTDIYASPINGYGTFFIYPCGSKAGWGDANAHLENIEIAENVIKSYEYEDGSNCIEYCIAIYGSSEG